MKKRMGQCYLYQDVKAEIRQKLLSYIDFEDESVSNRCAQANNA